MGAASLSALEALLGPIVNRQDDTFPPMEATVLHTDAGTVFVPHAFYAGMAVELPLARGLALAWAPCPEVQGGLLVLSGGNPADPTDESIAVTLSLDGIHALADSLLSITRQLDDRASASAGGESAIA